ncbi:MAG: hypothetical protein IPF93_13205 [Saprospiraceae bacterium]|nr:hypothetical protein [Saprospiraceae bacterium]
MALSRGDAPTLKCLKTNEVDGRWVFINGNNTPRIPRVDLTTFRTAEIIEIPNSAGNHSHLPSRLKTPNMSSPVPDSVYPMDNSNGDVPIKSYKQNFKGPSVLLKVDPAGPNMSIAFQILLPGVNFDLSHAGKGPSRGCFSFSMQVILNRPIRY